MPFYVTPDTLWAGPICAPVSWLDSEEEQQLWASAGELRDTCTGMPPPPLRITAPNGTVVELTDAALLDALENDYFSVTNVWKTTWSTLQRKAVPMMPVPVTPVMHLTPLHQLMPAVRMIPVAVQGGKGKGSKGKGIKVEGGVKHAREEEEDTNEEDESAKRQRTEPEDVGVEESKFGETEPRAPTPPEQYAIAIREEPAEEQEVPLIVQFLNDVGNPYFMQDIRESLLQGESLPREKFWELGNLISSRVFELLNEEKRKEMVDLWRVVVYIQLTCQQLLKQKAKQNQVLTAQGKRALNEYVEANVMFVERAMRKWAADIVRHAQRRASNPVESQAKIDAATQQLNDAFKQFILKVGIPSTGSRRDDSTVSFFFSMLMGNIEWRSQEGLVTFLGNVLLQYTLPRTLLAAFFLPVPQVSAYTVVPSRVGELLSDDRSWTASTSKSVVSSARLFLLKSLQYLGLLGVNVYLNVMELAKYTQMSVREFATLGFNTAVNMFMRREETVWSQVYQYLPGIITTNSWWQWVALPTDLVDETEGAVQPGVVPRMYMLGTAMYQEWIGEMRNGCVNNLTNYLMQTSLLKDQYPMITRVGVQAAVGLLMDASFLFAFKGVVTMMIPFIMSLTRVIRSKLARFGARVFKAWSERRYMAQVRAQVGSAPIKYRCNQVTHQCEEVRVGETSDRDVYDTLKECEKRCSLARLDALV